MNKLYNQLSEIERGMIEAYLEEGESISEIARTLKRSKSTISEEIKRGKYNGKYMAHIAQNRCLKRRRESHKHTKWRNTDLLHFIDTHLKQKWSPEIISVKWKEKTGRIFNVIPVLKPFVIKDFKPHACIKKISLSEIRVSV